MLMEIILQVLYLPIIYQILSYCLLLLIMAMYYLIIILSSIIMSSSLVSNLNSQIIQISTSFYYVSQIHY
jgi:hypothetical protein